MSFRWSLVLIALGVSSGHPLGNFSVNHYTRIEPTARGVDILYVIDFGEAASYDLLKDPSARAQRRWVDGLVFRSHGQLVTPEVLEVVPEARTGATANLTCLRVAIRMRVSADGELEFEDRNLADQTGWKEIVIRGGDGVGVTRASQGSVDRSAELRVYPADVSQPPRDLRASLAWTKGPVVRTVIVPLEQPSIGAPSVPTEVEPPQRDFLAALLGKKELSPWMVLSGLGAAFVLGALHAFTPGHGKTMVAAYLVGSRGTVRHAVLLGAMVTFTHTISVFGLGLVTLFLAQYVVPGKLIKALELISGVAIVAVGGWLLYQRVRALRSHAHHHHHDHVHEHHHHHDHDHHHDHHHGPGGHTHTVEGEVGIGSLIALGASGGLVPCPSALVLMLSAIAVGRVGFGLLLLVLFSLGLAVVLTAIGVIVVYTKHLLPDSKTAAEHPMFRWVPVASAAVIVVIGLVMTGVAAGWINPKLTV